MRLVVMPTTGRVFDYDSMPNTNSTTHRPGRVCPDSGLPCDEMALENFDLSSMHTPEARAQLLEAAKVHMLAIQGQLK